MDYYWWPRDCISCHMVSPSEMTQENLLENNVFVFQVSFATWSYVNGHIMFPESTLGVNIYCIIDCIRWAPIRWTVFYPLPPAPLHSSCLENIGVLTIWLIHFHPRHIWGHHDMRMLLLKCVSFSLFQLYVKAMFSTTCLILKAVRF